MHSWENITHEETLAVEEIVSWSYYSLVCTAVGALLAQLKGQKGSLTHKQPLCLSEPKKKPVHGSNWPLVEANRSAPGVKGKACF